MFGLFGWLWLRLKPETYANEALTRTLVPPLLGGIVVLLGVAVPTFLGNTFRYRDAFDLSLKKTVFADGKLAADAVLEIRKPGDYRFRAMRGGRDRDISADDPLGQKSPAGAFDR
jgi:hypothetical protein